MTGQPSDGTTPGSTHGVGPGGVVPPGLVNPATIGVALAVGAYVSVFVSVTTVVGGTTRLVTAVVAAAVVGVTLSTVIGERTAVRLTAVLFVAGLIGYYLTIPGSQRTLISARNVALDVVAFLTGLSVLRLAMAEVWALVVAPVPTFLVAYLAGRGRHVAASTVAGGTLGFFVLTGDAGTAVTLAGVVGIAGAAGSSTVSVAGGFRSHGDTLATVLAVMVLASATVTVLPVGATQPWAIDRGTTSLESTLSSDDELEVIGTTRLSPEVRFTMESPTERNWHTASYDRYTGEGWVRTGDRTVLDGTLDGPPGETTDVEVAFTAETEMEALPAPWQPVDVDGPVAETARVDDGGTIHPGAPVLPGERVTVESRVVDPPPDELRNASTEYDGSIESQYTQLPADTPDRVGDRTEEILADAGAENPYDQAAAMERYLIEEYDYSLTVERPEGDIADSFLFEMDAGYCTYFATTMVAMLRSQGVPAKLATGYTSGQQVAEDEYVVRGQDAHAWVMVYFPGHGWVEFDPTPSADRERARDTRLAEARADGVEDVDVERSEGGVVPGFQEDVRDPDVDVGDDRSDVGDEIEGDNNSTEIEDPLQSEGEGIGAEVLSESTPSGTETTGDGGTPLPSRDVLGYWLFVVVVLTASARHVGVTDRAYHAVRFRLPGRSRTPRADTERAFADLERVLTRRYRSRRPGETPRSYVAALREHDVDDRVHDVVETYERATYAGTVSRAEADDARRTVRRIVLESTPLIGRLFGRE